MGDVIKHEVNPVQLDGEPQIQVIRNPDIKLANKPYIVMAFPMGEKEISTVFECPDCDKKWLAPGHRAPHLVPFTFLTHHMNLKTPLNSVMAYLGEGGRLSAEARQIMTKKALRMGAKYILYWDDDVLPPDLGLLTLLNFMERTPKAGAISGVYTTRVSPQEPLIYKEHGKGAYWDMPFGEGAKPVPIMGAGAGFLLARLEAVQDSIDRMQEDNGDEEVAIWADERTTYADKEMPDDFSAKTIMWGHDIRFCRILNEHGWQVYGHGAVLCGHLDVEKGVVFNVPDDAPGMITSGS